MPQKTNPLTPLIDRSPMTGDDLKALITDLTAILKGGNPDSSVNVSQGDVAELLGTSQSRISAYVRGEPIPVKVAMLMRLIVARAREAMMPPALRPDPALLASLASIAVHADEATAPGAHVFDVLSIRPLIEQPAVQTFLGDMDAMSLIPRKRSRDRRAG